MSEWIRHPNGSYTQGDLMVWKFPSTWNVAVGWTASADGPFADHVVLMDVPTMAAARELAEAHAAGRVDLAPHASCDTESSVVGSRSWGGYAAIHDFHWRCSCGANGESDSAADGRRERIEHIREEIAS